MTASSPKSERANICGQYLRSPKSGWWFLIRMKLATKMPIRLRKNVCSHKDISGEFRAAKIIIKEKDSVDSRARITPLVRCVSLIFSCAMFWGLLIKRAEIQYSAVLRHSQLCNFINILLFKMQKQARKKCAYSTKIYTILEGISSVGFVPFLLTHIDACAKILLLFGTLKRCIILDARRMCGTYPTGQR